MSIITPTYNREAHLAQAIESVLGQDFTEWELIIVDDGSSTNASRLLADAYCRRDSRISFHERPHGGVSAARNYGIARARGEYLAFLDSDDRYLPGGLSRLVRELRDSPPSVKLVYGDFLKHYEVQGCEIPTRTRPPMRRPGLYFQFLIPQWNPVAPCACLLERSVIEEVGGFDSTFDGVEDRELWSRLVVRHDIRHFDTMVAIYRKHDKQITGNHPLRQLVSDRQIRHFFSSLSLETWFPGAATDTAMAQSLARLARALLNCPMPPFDSALHMLRLAQSRQFDHGREQFIRRLEAELPRILGERHGSGARIAKE